MSVFAAVPEAVVAAARRPPKAILLGDFGSGKTTLFRRLTARSGGNGGGGWAPVRLPDGNNILLHDTVDMEKFGSSLTCGYYRGASCILLVADATDLRSVGGLENWNTEARCYCPDAEKILVITKSDSRFADADLVSGDVEAYQSRLGCCSAVVVSSRTGQGMEQLLQGIANAGKLYRARKHESDVTRLLESITVALHDKPAAVPASSLSGSESLPASPQCKDLLDKCCTIG